MRKHNHWTLRREKIIRSCPGEVIPNLDKELPIPCYFTFGITWGGPVNQVSNSEFPSVLINIALWHQLSNLVNISNQKYIVFDTSVFCVKFVSVGTNELSCISVEGGGGGGGGDGLSVTSSYGPTAPHSPHTINVSAAHTLPLWNAPSPDLT